MTFLFACMMLNCCSSENTKSVNIKSEVPFLKIRNIFPLFNIYIKMLNTHLKVSL